MSGLAWVKLDTAFPRNHKVLALLAQKEGHRAAFVYLCGLAYAGEQGTDGFIPSPALAMIHGRQADAEKIVGVGLWRPRPGGWEINDWVEHQLATSETEARTKRAKAAAEARWGKGKPMLDAMQDALPNAFPDGMPDALLNAMPNAMQKRREEKRRQRREGSQLP